MRKPIFRGVFSVRISEALQNRAIRVPHGIDFSRKSRLFFGDIKINVANTILLKNQTLLDVEGGNIAFGGYGKKSSFVRKNGKTFPRPILISREIKMIEEIEHSDGLL